MKNANDQWCLSPSGRISVAVSIALGTQVPIAHGQDALEEIVVTARKRSENLQDIPQAILAISQADIARSGLQTMDDYARKIPSLTYVARGPGANKIVFRGVAEAGTAFFTDSSAALYLDEQPLTQPVLTPEPRLVDIARMEALSGPQGTLYGGSAQSGTLRIVTNKADPSAFAANVSASVSSGSTSDNSYDLSGVLNIPLVKDKLALRLVGFSAEDGGYIDNVLGSSPGGTFDNASVVEKNAAGEARYKGGRASLRWDANERWSLTGNIVFQDVDSSGDTDHMPDRVGDLQQVRFIDEFRNDRWTQYGLTVEGDLGFAQVVAATSYFTREILYQIDNTEYVAYLRGFYAAYGYYVSYAFGPDPVGQGWINPQDTRRFSQEIRLSHDGEKWAWLGGIYYERFDDHWDFQSRIADYESTNSFQFWYAYYGAQPGTTNNAFWNSNNHTQTEQYAAFGELTYQGIEDWDFTVGARWFDHERDRRYFVARPFGRLEQDLNPIQSENDLTLKFSASYRIDDDKMVYALYSEGFRNGGRNITRPGAVLPANYDPDFLQNYELGLKSQWANGRLRANVTAFHMVWEDYQLGVTDPGPLFATMIINVGDAEIDGLEIDMSALPMDGLEFELNALFLNAETTSDNSFIGVDAGARLPVSPELKVSSSLQYTFPQTLYGGNPYARVQYSYYGDSLNGVECNTADCFDPVVQPSYSISDVKFGIEAEGWEVNVFLNNLTDERARLYVTDYAPPGVVRVNRPREYGVGFTRRWGKQ
ncbi:MAG TPA: TonB-dependent receptor [Woeseiaceae bacterium]|nr:TonB-dependent receptor [Woeseiaceae bacterium]